MNPSVPRPTVHSLFPMGDMYGRSVLMVLAILILLYACYSVWRMTQGLRLLDQGTRIDRAKDSAAPCEARQGQIGQSDSWR